MQDHPRLCGEKRIQSNDDPIDSGITPAYAGKSQRPFDVFYPQTGSPPPMRGKDKEGRNIDFAVRITPAYAGKRFR